jgi:hypothetical protein
MFEKGHGQRVIMVADAVIVMSVSATWSVARSRARDRGFHDPSEGAFDDPPAAQDHKAGHERQAADNLEGNLGLVLRPGDKPSGVAAIREDGLYEREAATGLPSRSNRF